MSYCGNSSIYDIEKLGSECYCFKKLSYSKTISNLVFISVKKRYTAGEIVLISTNIIVFMLILLLVLLAMKNIVL